MVSKDKVKKVRAGGESFYEIDISSELPSGEEIHIPDPEDFTREYVRGQIESAAEKALFQANKNTSDDEPVTELALIEHARHQANIVDTVCNRGHFYSFPYIIYCENLPGEITAWTSWRNHEDILQSIEDLAARCIQRDIEAEAKRLAKELDVEYEEYEYSPNKDEQENTEEESSDDEYDLEWF